MFQHAVPQRRPRNPPFAIRLPNMPILRRSYLLLRLSQHPEQRGWRNSWCDSRCWIGSNSAEIQQDLPQVQDRGCGVFPVATEICRDGNETLLCLLWMWSHFLMIPRVWLGGVCKISGVKRLHIEQNGNKELNLPNLRKRWWHGKYFN